jgi:hypothetical protein
MQSADADADDERGIATWKVELFVSLCLLVLGSVVAFKSWQLGAGWRDDGPGAGYFPFYIGSFIALASAGILTHALRVGRHDPSVFVTNRQLRLVLTVLLPTIGFAIAVQFLGLYIGSWLFISGFMVWVGHYSWPRSTAIGFAVMAIAFLMFEVWFKVPLFKGSLNPLRVLGY